MADGDTFYDQPWFNTPQVPGTPGIPTGGAFGGGFGPATFNIPDFRGLATEEAGLANALRVNQRGPEGSVTWNPYQSINPVTGQPMTRWERVTGLDPRRQQMFDAGNSMMLAMLGQIQGTQGAPLSMAGLPSRLGVPGPLDRSGLPNFRQTDVAGLPEITASPELRRRAEDAVYGRFQSRLDPRFEEDERNLVVALRNRGLRPGDQAFEAEMDRFDRARNDAYQAAAQEAVGAGRAEAAQEFGQQFQRRGQRFTEEARLADDVMRIRDALNRERLGVGEFDLSRARLSDQLRRGAFDERLQQRGVPLAETSQLAQILRGFSGVPRFAAQGFQQTAPQLLRAGELGYRSELDRYQGGLDERAAEDARAAADRGGFFDLASASLPLIASVISDRRLKTAIRRIGTWRGHGLYAYRYRWGTESVGVMSDEVNPEAVSVGPDGFDRVDYTRVA